MIKNYDLLRVQQNDTTNTKCKRTIFLSNFFPPNLTDFRRDTQGAEKRVCWVQTKNYFWGKLPFNLILQNELSFEILLTAVPPFMTQKSVKLGEWKKKVIKFNNIVVSASSRSCYKRRKTMTKEQGDNEGACKKSLNQKKVTSLLQIKKWSSDESKVTFRFPFAS